mmetsp:Transcript_13408/g.20199  ORF Transcript_13408/g.20199 Transcript_13408/m.20199 type:complete len:107 (-) Transcript_13408:18-338(-)
MTPTVKWAVRFAECIQRHPDQVVLSLRCSRIATKDVRKGDKQISSFIVRLEDTAECLHGAAPAERWDLPPRCLAVVAQLLAGHQARRRCGAWESAHSSVSSVCVRC